MSEKQDLINSVGAVAEMAWIFYTALRDVGADVSQAALITRQYLIATMIASMHSKDGDTTEDEDGSNCMEKNENG